MALTISNLSFKLSADTTGLTSDFSTASDTIKKVGSVVSTVSVDFGSMNDKLANVRAGINNVTNAAKGLWSRFMAMSAEARSFGGALGKSLAIMGDVSAEMKGKLIKSMQQASFATTTLSMKDMADALFYLSSAGLDAEAALAALGPVATFAQAGAFDVAEATELVTGAQAAMGLSSKDANENLMQMKRTMDVLTRANVLSQASIQEFADALASGAASSGKLFDQSLEQVVATLAAYAKQNVKAADGSTQYSIAMRDLTTRAIKNREAFAAAGITVYDSAGKVRFFGDILADLERRLSPMTTEMKKMELATLGFQDKSVSAIVKVLGMSDSIKEYHAELQKATGYTDQVATKTMGEFKSAIEAINTSMESLKIAFFTPILVQFGKAINLVMNSLRGLHGVTAQNVLRVVAFTTAFSASLLIFPKVVVAIRGIVAALKAMAVGQSIVSALSGPAGLANLAIGVAAAGAAVYSLNAVMDNLDSTTTDAAAATSAMTAPVKDLAAAMDDAKESTDEAADSVKKAKTDWEQVGKSIKDSVAGPMDKYREKVESLKQAVLHGAVSWETFSKAANKAVGELVEAERVKSSISANTQGVGAALAGTTSGFSAVQEARRAQAAQNKTDKDQLDESKKHTRLLEQIRREVQVDFQINQARL